MGLIINVEIPAGPTIYEAIKDCVIFAQKNGVMVKTEINDIPMLISYGKLFGATTNDLNRNIENCTQTFLNSYHVYREQAESKKKSAKDQYENLLKDPYIKKIFKERHGYGLN